MLTIGLKVHNLNISSVNVVICTFSYLHFITFSKVL